MKYFFSSKLGINETPFITKCCIGKYTCLNLYFAWIFFSTSAVFYEFQPVVCTTEFIEIFFSNSQGSSCSLALVFVRLLMSVYSFLVSLGLLMLIGSSAFSAVFSTISEFSLCECICLSGEMFGVFSLPKNKTKCNIVFFVVR